MRLEDRDTGYSIEVSLQLLVALAITFFLLVGIVQLTLKGRYPAMRIIKNSMLSKMGDNDIRSLSGYLRSKKDLLGKLEEALGASLSSKIKIVSGL